MSTVFLTPFSCLVQIIPSGGQKRFRLFWIDYKTITLLRSNGYCVLNTYGNSLRCESIKIIKCYNTVNHYLGNDLNMQGWYRTTLHFQKAKSCGFLLEIVKGSTKSQSAWAEKTKAVIIRSKAFMPLFSMSLSGVARHSRLSLFSCAQTEMYFSREFWYVIDSQMTLL